MPTTLPPALLTRACFSSPLSTGKERDGETGNDYFGARYYASSMGRFLSPDWSAKAEPVPYAKLDNPQSLNLYGGWPALTPFYASCPAPGCPVQALLGREGSNFSRPVARSKPLRGRTEVGEVVPRSSRTLR